ncbi:FecR family protein [Chitinophaga sp. sic0106]|uniref:FecR family protein n=1 Tax=Chitinophaga sp. sic0106 TaxID=2854785 RepID=UPI001C47306A|nr:FecR domain-containing protein [Chitinophaga sp. sic0106]MBV7533793.1 DUF4974 domain-containing protein [Chitinophaga sp. sic0106]
MSEQSRIYALMARKAAGEASAEELEELEQLLLENPELQYAFNIVVDIREVQEPDNFTDEEAEALKAKGLEQLAGWLQQEPDPVKRHHLTWKVFAAIAASAGLLIGTFFYWPKSGTTTFANQVVTRNGSKSTMVLPDGSTVALNACSQLQYDADKFLKGNREVTLTGEAYFDIRHDPAHPFIVHSGKVNIKVLGTSFNVKAYPEDKNIETTLISGKVAVSFKTTNEEEVILLPAQRLIISKLPSSDTRQSAQQAALTNYSVAPVRNTNTTVTETATPTAWMSDRFEFDSITLEELSHDLERWYNVHIIFKNEKYKQELFTGVFKKQQLEEVLNALQLTLGFNYEIDKDKKTVIIR